MTTTQGTHTSLVEILSFLLFLSWWRALKRRSNHPKIVKINEMNWWHRWLHIPNSPILSNTHELRSIVVNKSRIHGEIRKFWDIFWNSIKSDNEMWWEIRKIDKFEKRTQRQVHGIKNIWFGSRFVEKSKSELGKKIWTRRERNPKFKRKLTKSTILNYNLMIHDKRLGRKHIM